MWDPAIKVLLKAWWEHDTKGTPYNAPKKRIVFLMKDGGVDLAPYHQFENIIPTDVQDAVANAESQIKAGTLTVPMDTNRLIST